MNISAFLTNLDLGGKNFSYKILLNVFTCYFSVDAAAAAVHSSYYFVFSWSGGGG